MSLVVNMHQRRTVASGRQNQDPNTPVVPEKEKTPKQACPKLERSIQEVLNHTRNTTGRGRQMVLAALQKKQAAEKTSPAASKTSQPGKNSARGNAKKNSEGARSAVVPVELKRNKLSISDNRKRPLEHEETRAPLSALNGSTPNKLESDWTSDWITASPAKPAPREGTAVYKKRQKTGATPPTPPLRSSGRRQETKAASPPPPPVFQSNSPHVRSRRKEFKAASPPPPSVLESKSPRVRNEKISLPEASKPVVDHVVEKGILQRVRRQLISPTKGRSASNRFSSVRNNADERSSFAHLRDLDTQVLEVETQPSIAFTPGRPDTQVLEVGTQPSISFTPGRPDTQGLEVGTQPSISFTPGRPDTQGLEVETQPSISFTPGRPDTQGLEVETQPSISFTPGRPDTQGLEVETQPSISFTPGRPDTEGLEVETQPSISFTPGRSDTQGLEVETQPSFPFISKSARRLHGLMNLGNTCYMNVIVQVLCNLPSFVNGMDRFFGPIVSQNALEGSESFPDIESVHAALLKVFRDLKRAERYETVNPTLLKHAFAKNQSSFWGCIQQDAHEFFCSLIDQVQEDVSSTLKKQYSIEADRPKLETVCPTTQNFSCSVRNNLTCAGCGNVSSVEETYRDFSLALPEDERTDESKNCSLESLLSLYFQETTMSRKCEKCGVEDTKAKAQILKLPHVLVLQLKRLHMDRDIPCTKVSAPVKFTSRLDIGPWCAQDKRKFWSPTTDNVQKSDRVEAMTSTCTTENDLRTGSEGNMDCGFASSFEFESQELPSTPNASSDLSTCYRLHGVVNHLGQSAFGGHFLTDILDPEEDRWLRCDDSLVTDASEESVFANVREAYMFFYVHEPAGTKATD